MDAGPKVSISVSPLSGDSPVTVNFSGNAISSLPIDENKTKWDFDINDLTTINVNSRTAQYTYVVDAGETKEFIARLTMVDTAGNIGSAQIGITVKGPASDSITSGGGDQGIRIIIGVPGTVGSDVDEGTSPFQVELSLDTSELSGSLQAVRWDLGDGTSASSLFVTHTYVNETEEAFRLPITATITTLSSGGITGTIVASRRITVLPGSAVTEPPDVTLDGTVPAGAGGSAMPCGAVGLLPLAVMMASMMWLRRERF